jgi:hypothetical protein
MSENGHPETPDQVAMTGVSVRRLYTGFNDLRLADPREAIPDVQIAVAAAPGEEPRLPTALSFTFGLEKIVLLIPPEALRPIAKAFADRLTKDERLQLLRDLTGVEIVLPR